MLHIKKNKSLRGMTLTEVIIATAISQLLNFKILNLYYKARTMLILIKKRCKIKKDSI